MGSLELWIGVEDITSAGVVDCVLLIGIGSF